MNKVYRNIWNAALGCWIAVQENARARGAGGRSSTRSRGGLAAGALAVAAAWAAVTHDVRASVANQAGSVVIAEDNCNNSTIGGSGLNYWAQGCNAYASNTDSIAIGTSSFANGVSAIALGDHSNAIADGAMALGGGATASGVQSVALGGDKVDPLQNAAAKATGERAVAVGAATLAQGDNSIALGSAATAAANNAVVIGSGSTVSAPGSVVLGANATGSGANAAAIGASATASGASSAAMGNLAVANGQNAIALGTSASASADNAIAMGQGSKGAVSGGIAIGQLATAQGTNSIALGYHVRTGSTLTADGNIAIGANANIANKGSGIIVIGRSATLKYDGGTPAITGDGSIVIGDGASIFGTNSTALGAHTYSQYSGATLVGAYASSSVVGGGTALGQSASVSASNAVALGADSVADRANAVSVGSATASRQIINVTAGEVSNTSTDAVNGSQLYTTNANVTAVSNTVNKITSGGGITYFHTNSTLADSSATGANSTAIGPVAFASGGNAIAIGNAANTAALNAVVIGANATAAGSGSMALGSSSYAHSSGSANGQSTAIGSGTSASGDFSTAVGSLASSQGDASTALGVNATAGGSRSVSIGASSVASGSYATGVGTLATASGANAAAFGTSANASATNSVAIGSGANASVANSVALGNGATTAAAVNTPNGVIGGQTFTYAGATPTGVVSVGKAGSERQVMNVAAGRVTAASTDAVNGSQLYATNTQVTTNSAAISTLQALTADAVMYDSTAHDSVTFVAVGSSKPVALHNVAPGALNDTSNDAVNGSQLFKLASSTASGLGGGSTVNSDGSITTPTYTVGGSTYHNAGDVFTNIDGRVNDLADDLSSGTIGLVQQDPTSRTITVAKNTDGTVIDFTGTTGTRVLTGVSAGAVSNSSYDAVNGSQLFKLASSTASGLGGGSTVNSDGSITTPTYTIGGSTYHNAGDVFTNIDGRVSDLADDLSSGTIGLVQQDPTSRTITVAKNTDGTVIDFTGTTGTRVLTGVSAGAVNDTSNDAVNGSQLYKLASSTAGGLGGGSTVNSDGSITTPTYTVGGSTYHNAGDVFTNIDGRVSDLADDLSSGTIGLVQQDPTSRAITVAKNTDGTVIDFTGTTGTRVLTGVSPGALNAQSTEAVNGSQLYATNVQVKQNTTDIASLQGNMTNLQGQMANAVSYDTSAHDSLTFGDGINPVSLHNVAAGMADTDAVNLGQMNDAIASVQQAADAAANPFVAAQGNRDTEGAQAKGAYATAVGANAVASGANAVALGANTQASGANSVALGADSVADRDNAVSVGSAGRERQITNVAPGTAGTDAANMNQLNAMAAQGQGYVDQRISGVQNQISDVRKDAFGAAAAAMAVAGLPQPTEAGKTMVAAGGSRIGGQTGMALGVSYVTRNNRWVAKASASSSSQGNTGVTVAAGYQW